jgi:hypothetical protein
MLPRISTLSVLENGQKRGLLQKFTSRRSLPAVCPQFAFCQGGQIQKANSGYLLPEFGRRVNHLANQFAISSAVGSVLGNGKQFVIILS